MSEVPCVPDPSSLVWKERLGLRAQDLCEECKDILQSDKDDQHRALVTIYHESQDWGERAEPGERAILLIFLADIARMEGKLGPALEFGREAAQIVKTLPSVEHRHNYGVALYSLGLTCQLLGMDMTTMDCYEQAHQVLKEVCQEWQRAPQHAGTKKFQTHCDCMIPRIKQLRDYVSQAHRYDGTSAILAPILVSRWVPENQSKNVDQMSIQVKVKSITLDISIGRNNVSHQLDETEIPLDREIHYIVLDDHLRQPKFVGEDDLSEEIMRDVVGFFKAA